MVLGEKGLARGSHQKRPWFCLPLPSAALPPTVGSGFRVSGRKKQSNGPGPWGILGSQGKLQPWESCEVLRAEQGGMEEAGFFPRIFSVWAL